MRKILSIVIAVLMVSMMIPSMALADAAISVEVPAAALVAGESFTLTPAVTDGSDTVKLEVNKNVFTITGGTTEGNINALEAAAGTTFTVTVNAAIPAEPFTSNIRVSTASNSEKFAISVADRLIGDVNFSEKTDLTDAIEIMKSIAKLTSQLNANYKEVVGDVNNSGKTDLTDAIEIMKNIAKVSGSNQNIGANYIGGNADVDVTTDPFDESGEPDEPDVPAVTVGEVTKLYAYYQSGTVYYTFTAGANATSYAISVNGVAVELSDPTATSGSFTCANWNDDGENTIAVVAKADGATDSAEVTKVIEVADANGTLAAWLTENGLNDVTITVYEIQ